jgi:hypothetical protein
MHTLFTPRGGQQEEILLIHEPFTQYRVRSKESLPLTTKCNYPTKWMKNEIQQESYML